MANNLFGENVWNLPPINFSDVISINKVNLDSGTNDLTVVELAKIMLERIMLLDSKSRSINAVLNSNSVLASSNQNDEDDIWGDSEITNQLQVNPMDIFLYIFLRSDHLFRQILLSQATKCQLSLPLVVIDPRNSKPTYFSFAFHTLVKGYNDKHGNPRLFPVIHEKLNFISFIRIGTCSESQKSSILNNVLGILGDSFLNRQSNGFSQEKVLFNGTVEINWYLPRHHQKVTEFTDDPIMFLNLRGDALTFEKQLSFILDVSTIIYVFITLSDLRDDEFTQFKRIMVDFGTKFCLVFIGPQTHKERLTDLKKLPNLCQDKEHVVRASGNIIESAQLIQKGINSILSKHLNTPKLSIFESQKFALKHGFNVDEDDQLIRYSLIHQTSISEIIESAISQVIMRSSTLAFVKDVLLPLQLQDWEMWCKCNRDKHQMRYENKTGTSFECKQNNLRANLKFSRSQQIKKLMQPTHLTIELLKIIKSCQNDFQQLQYFWRGIQILFDHLCLKYSPLVNQTKCTERPTNYEINNNSLVIEHIFRELSQVYEAFLFSSHVEKDEIISAIEFDPIQIPKMFANLILSGHSFEILDGFVNHVALGTVSSVLSELSLLVGKDKRIFVLSIIGIQSSGKSTLLNTMFGLQFPVASGRCTRGVFMQLISINAELTQSLGYHYIIVLDTEGLRAPELSGQVSFTHDNELTTFVVGLCDLTIINLFGEDQSQFQDILQIAVLALIRMKLSYKKPRCIFIHQNVLDIDAKQNLSFGKQKFLEILDEVTITAAKIESSSDLYKSFSDVIEYNYQTDTEFFPALLKSSPPMSIVSNDYSNMAEYVKNKIIFTYSAQMSILLTFTEWRDKLELIWNSLLNENFVFNFQNVRERNAAFEFDEYLGNWTSNFSHEVFKCQNKLRDDITVSTAENIESILKNSNKTVSQSCKQSSRDEQQTIMNTLFVYHKDKDIFSKWEVRAENHFKFTRENKRLEMCEDLATHYKYIKQALAVTTKYEQQKTQILEKAKAEMTKLPRDFTNDTNQLLICELFETLWAEWCAGLTEAGEEPFSANILGDLEDSIDTSLSFLGLSEEERMSVIIDSSLFEEFGKDFFLIFDDDYSIYDQRDNVKTFGKKCENLFRKFRDFKDYLTKSKSFNVNKKNDNNLDRIYLFIENLSNQVNDYVQNINRAQPYNISYFERLIRLVVLEIQNFNTAQENQAFSRIYLKPILTLALSFYQCCRKIPDLESIHLNFLKNNSTNTQLARIRMELEPIFMSYCQGTQLELYCANSLSLIVFEGMQNFLDTFLHEEIIQLFQNDPANSDIFRTRVSLQINVLKELAEKENFEEYIQYILDPISYLKNWIKCQLSEYSTKPIVLDRVMTTVLRPKIQEIEAHYLLSLKNCFASISTEVKPAFREHAVTFYHSVSDYMRNIPLTRFDYISVFDTPISNSDEFIEYFSSSFKTQLEKHCWAVWLKNLLSQNLNYQLISDYLLQCQSLCPFCSEPCLLSSLTHDHYCCSLHRPTGIRGWHYEHNDKFATNECTISLKRKEKFKHLGISYKMADYKTVNEHFASWKILKEDAVESKYWQWVFYTFRFQFMEYYNYKFNNEIDNWSDLQKEDVISNLNTHYQNFQFKTHHFSH